MLKRLMFMALCLAWLPLAVPAIAQEPATLVLKSGERLSGQLVDYGAGGFTITVNGQRRTVNTNDVAVVEFAGEHALTSDQQQQLNSGQQLVVLANGQTVPGYMDYITGTAPLKITWDTPNGQQTYNSTDVAQIYFAAPPASTQSAVGTSGVAPAGMAQQTAPNTFIVPGNQQWVATGLNVRQGENVYFQSSGQIQFSPDPNDKAQNAGAFNQKHVAGAPLPNMLAGALIGRIGNGEPFAIGNQAVIPMPESGPLYLGVNDDNVGDNSGQFTVKVTPGK